jgi:hypothetical protein
MKVVLSFETDKLPKDLLNRINKIYLELQQFKRLDRAEYHKKYYRENK